MSRRTSTSSAKPATLNDLSLLNQHRRSSSAGVARDSRPQRIDALSFACIFGNIPLGTPKSAKHLDTTQSECTPSNFAHSDSRLKVVVTRPVNTPEDTYPPCSADQIQSSPGGDFTNRDSHSVITTASEPPSMYARSLGAEANFYRNGMLMKPRSTDGRKGGEGDGYEEGSEKMGGRSTLVPPRRGSKESVKSCDEGSSTLLPPGCRVRRRKTGSARKSEFGTGSYTSQSMAASLTRTPLRSASWNRSAGLSGMVTPTIGTVTSGTLTPGTLTPGTLTPGTLTPGTLTPGTLTPGTLTPGTLTPGPLTPGTLTLGASAKSGSMLRASMKNRQNFTGPGFASLPPTSSSLNRITIDKDLLSSSASDSFILKEDVIQSPTSQQIRPIADNMSDVGSHGRRGSRAIFDRLFNADDQAATGPSDNEAVKTSLARRALSIMGINGGKHHHEASSTHSSRLRETADNLVIRTKLRHITTDNTTMGNNCCGGRSELAAKDTTYANEALNFLTARGPMTDLDRFDTAYNEFDIPELVSLIASMEPFDQPSDENMHPWASPPTTVGALVITHLAALASTDDNSMKEKIRLAGAIPILVQKLGSKEEDVSDAALVALSFLSIDFARGCMDMFEANILSALVPLLKRSKQGVRAAAAQTARNIYVLEVRYRRAFRDAGGCQALVDLLTLPTTPAADQDYDVQLEAVYHIDDFIMVNGEEVSDCVAAIKVTNIVRKLEALLQEEGNNDLREAARQLYLRVAE